MDATGAVGVVGALHITMAVLPPEPSRANQNGQPLGRHGSCIIDHLEAGRDI